MKSLSRINTIENILNKMNAPPYRKRQVYEGIYKQHKETFGNMTSIPKDLRVALAQKLGKKVLCLKKYL